LLARPTPVRFVIISAGWHYAEDAAPLLSDLIAQFDPGRTRILLIGRVPEFRKSSLECVVFSDLYGETRDRCVRPRRELEAEYSAITAAVKATAAKFGNVRYIDPFDVFCDETTCRPFGKDAVFFSDRHHVSPRGADEIYDAFTSDFLWLAGAANGKENASLPSVPGGDRQTLTSR
jgi:hypothetical protein